MTAVLMSLLAMLRGAGRSRVALHLADLALRHQLQVLQRSRPRRLRLAKADRWLWAWLLGVWTEWRTALVIVKPETVIAWHRQGFRLFWTWKSRRRTGRPSVTADVHILIRTMAQDNPLWGAPRIHGELLKLGVDVSQATVAKYVGRRDSKPPSQTWRDVPREPSPATRGRRFLRRPDGHVPTVVRPRDPRARAAPGRARCGHGPSDGGVDCATASRGVSLERGTSLSGP